MKEAAGINRGRFPRGQRREGPHPKGRTLGPQVASCPVSVSLGKVERSFALPTGYARLQHASKRPLRNSRWTGVLHQPGVTAALAGSSNDSHMRENAQAAAQLDLPDSIRIVSRAP